MKRKKRRDHFLRRRRLSDQREHAQNEAVLARQASRTANATIVIAVASVLTFGAAVLQYLVFSGQLAEMRATGVQTDKIIATYGVLAEAASKQADAAIEGAKTARDGLIASQRAWVGPRNAKSEKAPELETELTAIVEYQNNGREPALETIFDTDAFVAAEEEDKDGSVARRIVDFINRCKVKWTPQQATVVFPSSGAFGASYNLSRVIGADMIDQDVLDGKTSIFLSGCFVYKTALTIHRSSFCYYFKAKKTLPSNWSICQVGNDAD